MEPSPLTLSARTKPPCSSMIFLVMDRPRPVPCPTSFVEKKGSKIRFYLSPSIPGPLSDTLRKT